MAVDQAQARLDERLRDAGVAGRRAVAKRLREAGFARAWAAADRAGPMTELERARFLLRRLYPDLEGPRLEGLMTRLEAEWDAGTWAGFRRRATDTRGDALTPVARERSDPSRPLPK